MYCYYFCVLQTSHINAAWLTRRQSAVLLINKSRNMLEKEPTISPLSRKLSPLKPHGPERWTLINTVSSITRTDNLVACSQTISPLMFVEWQHPVVQVTCDKTHAWVWHFVVGGICIHTLISYLSKVCGNLYKFATSSPSFLFILPKLMSL